MTRYQDGNSEKAFSKQQNTNLYTRDSGGARTTEIARRAGVTHAMLHYYFNTKEQLYLKVVEQKLELIKNFVISIFLDNEKPLSEVLEECIKNHLNILRQSPDLPLFVLAEMKRNDEFTQEVFETLRDELQKKLVSFQRRLDEASDQGLIGRISAPALFMDIFSLNLASVMLSTAVKRFSPDGLQEDYWHQREQETITVIKKRLQIIAVR